MFLAFFLFCTPQKLIGSLPLTETINTIPEGEIEIFFFDEVIKIAERFRRETYGLGFGLTSSFSIWYSFQYLHRGVLSSRGNELGDSFFKVWYNFGNFFEYILHLGILGSFRLSTGTDAYIDDEWRNLSFGNNELKLGPVFQLDVNQIFVHINTFYVFRESYCEGFFNGIYINPMEKKTYTKLFGLNFLSNNTFMEKDRLKNDYLVFSIAVNTDCFYPCIPYFEVYTSRRVYRKRDNDSDHISIEGAGVNPVMFSIGFRYFYSYATFIGLYLITNPIRDSQYIRDIFGFDFSLQF